MVSSLLAVVILLNNAMQRPVTIVQVLCNIGMCKGNDFSKTLIIMIWFVITLA